jgi:hypothetical protein
MTKIRAGFEITGAHKDFEIRVLAVCKGIYEAQAKLKELKEQGAVMLIISEHYEWK